jgi:hypothetical protein
VTRIEIPTRGEVRSNGREQVSPVKNGTDLRFPELRVLDCAHLKGRGLFQDEREKTVVGSHVAVMLGYNDHGPARGANAGVDDGQMDRPSGEPGGALTQYVPSGVDCTGRNLVG